MAFPLIPILGGIAAVLLFRRKRVKPPSGITVFDGQGDNAPDGIDVVRGERFAIRFWAPEVQEWILEGGATGVVRPMSMKFADTSLNGLVPSVFGFEAKYPGEVDLDFALQGKGQASGPAPISVTIRARVK